MSADDIATRQGDFAAIRATPGEHLEDVVRRAVHVAQLTHLAVRATHNGRSVWLDDTDDVGIVVYRLRFPGGV